MLDISIIIKYLPILAKASVITLELAVLSGVFGLLIGLLVALAKQSSNLILHYLAVFYIWIIRSTPLLVQLFIIYYGMPQFGIDISPFTAGVLGLAINIAAYNAETIRAGIEAIPVGQTEAARSLGFSKAMTMKWIVLPQAFRIVVPPLGNNFIILIKDTTLVSTITVVELLMRTQQLVSATYKPFELYLAAALIYAFFITLAGYGLRKIERSMKRGK